MPKLVIFDHDSGYESIDTRAFSYKDGVLEFYINDFYKRSGSVGPDPDKNAWKEFLVYG